MNLISNTCLSALLTKDSIKQEYENPFCWNVIDFNSMYYLIKNFENINFNNFDLTKDDKWNFTLVIDNNIKVKYVHYLFDKNAKQIITKGPNVYYCKIWEYIIKKYIERTERMLKIQNKPIFIIGSIHHLKDHSYTENEILKICKICTEKGYKCIIANKNFDFSTKYPNIKFIKTKSTDKQFGNGGFAKEIYPQIKEYLNEKSL